MENLEKLIPFLELKKPTTKDIILYRIDYIINIILQEEKINIAELFSLFETIKIILNKFEDKDWEKVDLALQKIIKEQERIMEEKTIIDPEQKLII